jgi:LPS export ABC transporter protein LptC
MHRIAPLIFVIFVMLGCYSCKNDIQVVNDLTTRPAELPMRTAKDAELLYSDSARVKVKLLAPQLDQYVTPDARIVMPHGVNIKFYNDSMRVTTHLTANSAVRREKDNLMEAHGNVVVVNRKGDKLVTEKLIWNEKKRIIYTDVHVLITTASGDILEGNGMESNEDFTHYKITKPIGQSAFDK